MKLVEIDRPLGSRLALLPTVRPSKVEIVFQAPEAREVFIAGDFNHWNPRSVPLRKESNGAWRTLLLLAPGSHEYRFVVDGRWQCDPRAPRSVPNPFGSRNSVLRVK